jgi:K+-sensing histidine kinase KdpD
MVAIGFGYYSLPIDLIIEHVATASIVSALIIIGAVMFQDYVGQVQTRNIELDWKTWELEVYSQLLRHDLRNDLQAMLNALELSDMLREVNPELAHEHNETSQAIGNRIIRLLGVFSAPVEEEERSIVRLIRKLAEEAERTYPGMRVIVETTDAAREVAFTSSRLMHTVWTNVFRNAAEHAGFEPVVSIAISVNEHELLIRASDNGPGVPEAEKEWLFRRGKGEMDDSRGIGLYLVRMILESHGGSIQLVEDPECSGCTLQVSLPISV